MDWVNNEESMYNDKIGIFDKWVEEGDAWGRIQALKEARALAAHFAEHIESFESTEGKYTPDEVRQAADEMVEEFESEYRDQAIESAVKEASRKPTPKDLEMDPGDIEHAKKYEEMARKIGVEAVRKLIPASPQKVRRALERGDKYLNSIPLRKWDAAAFQLNLPGRRMSLAEGVCVLKHVAKWHYA